MNVQNATQKIDLGPAVPLLVEWLKMRRGSVKVAGLGTFMTVKLKARNYRHPKTGEMSCVGPRTVVRFKPSSKLKF